MTQAAAAIDAAHALRYRLEPVTATFTGVHGHDGALPDWSANGLAAAADAWRAADPALAAAKPGNEWEAMDAELLRGHAAIRLSEDLGTHGVRRNPSLWTGEAVTIPVEGIRGYRMREFSRGRSAAMAGGVLATLAVVAPYLKVIGGGDGRPGDGGCTESCSSIR